MAKFYDQFSFGLAGSISPTFDLISLEEIPEGDFSLMAKQTPPTIATPPIDIGISQADRHQIATGLSKLLADTYTLYLKTHNFHWNVTGPMFQTLHLMFEAQYNELALAVDLIAERIRALGFPAPGSYKQFAELSSIAEADGVPGAEEMIRQLVAGQEAVVRTAAIDFSYGGNCP